MYHSITVKQQYFRPPSHHHEQEGPDQQTETQVWPEGSCWWWVLPPHPQHPGDPEHDCQHHGDTRPPHLPPLTPAPPTTGRSQTINIKCSSSVDLSFKYSTKYKIPVLFKIYTGTQLNFYFCWFISNVPAHSIHSLIVNQDSFNSEFTNELWTTAILLLFFDLDFKSWLSSDPHNALTDFIGFNLIRMYTLQQS